MKDELVDELRVSIDTTPATNYPASISTISSASTSLSIARAHPEPLLYALDLVLVLKKSPASSLLAEVAPISDFRPQNGYLSDLCWGA